MTREKRITDPKTGKEIYVPELIFNFATLFLLRLHETNEDHDEMLWTLSRDRQDRGIWVPPGGEVIFPDEFKDGDTMDIADTALQETAEEVGVRAHILGPGGPFCTLCLPFNYRGYTALITDSIKPEDRSGRLLKANGCHAMFNYYVGMALPGEPEPFCRAQPDEPHCETVDLKWLGLKASLEAIKKGELKTYGTIETALEKLARIMARQLNPFHSPAD